MSSAHFDAAEQLLRAGLDPGIQIHDTDASHVAGSWSAYPYVVLSAGITVPFSDDLANTHDDHTGLLRVTVAATTAASARRVLDQTRAALSGGVLALPGRLGWGCSIEDSAGVDVDRDVVVVGPDGQHGFAFFAVDIYRIGSTAYQV